jgi:DNA mismatch endonuclease (patch repair protein)
MRCRQVMCSYSFARRRRPEVAARADRAQGKLKSHLARDSVVRDPPIPESRSRLMARIRSANTAPELAVRRALTATGVRYRLHDRGLTGRPDFAIRRAKVAIFVDGCFWHGCPHHYNRPHVRRRYWDAKIASNRARRAIVLKTLASDGWKSFELWECEIRSNLKDRLAPIVHAIRVREAHRIKDAK